MATIKDLLGERVQALRELTDRIQQELEGDADLEKLSTLADELGGAGDSFAATITKAQEALTGGGDGGGEDEQAGGEGGWQSEGGEAAEEGAAAQEGEGVGGY